MRQLLRDRFGRVGFAFALVGAVTLFLSLTRVPAEGASLAICFVIVGCATLLAGLVRLHRQP